MTNLFKIILVETRTISRNYQHKSQRDSFKAEVSKIGNKITRLMTVSLSLSFSSYHRLLHFHTSLSLSLSLFLLEMCAGIFHLQFYAHGCSRAIQLSSCFSLCLIIPFDITARFYVSPSPSAFLPPVARSSARIYKTVQHIRRGNASAIRANSWPNEARSN